MDRTFIYAALSLWVSQRAVGQSFHRARYDSVLSFVGDALRECPFDLFGLVKMLIDPTKFRDRTGAPGGCVMVPDPTADVRCWANWARTTGHPLEGWEALQPDKQPARRAQHRRTTAQLRGRPQAPPVRLRPYMGIKSRTRRAI